MSDSNERPNMYEWQFLNRYWTVMTGVTEEGNQTPDDDAKSLGMSGSAASKQKIKFFTHGSSVRCHVLGNWPDRVAWERSLHLHFETDGERRWLEGHVMLPESKEKTTRHEIHIKPCRPLKTQNEGLWLQFSLEGDGDALSHNGVWHGNS